MKKVNLSDRIQLDREIISKLNDDQLKELEGGQTTSLSCITGTTSCVYQVPDES
ncbi:class I lanthipeptide [Pedobacter cryoconitis]|uniref:Bacteriocin-like protein n=1 Tax=Pedobacter cryoconitis TaxID=188932 RepID=A0A7X0J3Z4_9SPHI|nr:class I lanthipeptide [Pedobacter cryoconitis]MBB6499226.1 hypothetical protein [Pedobacter cryoconitis]